MPTSLRRHAASGRLSSVALIDCCSAVLLKSQQNRNEECRYLFFVGDCWYLLVFVGNYFLSSSTTDCRAALTRSRLANYLSSSVLSDMASSLSNDSFPSDISVFIAPTTRGKIVAFGPRRFVLAGADLALRRFFFGVGALPDVGGAVFDDSRSSSRSTLAVGT